MSKKYLILFKEWEWLLTEAPNLFFRYSLQVPFNRHEILVVEAKIYKNTKQKANQQARPEVICKESALNHHKRGLVQEGNPVFVTNTTPSSSHWEWNKKNGSFTSVFTKRWLIGEQKRRLIQSKMWAYLSLLVIHYKQTLRNGTT